jgi:subtilisin-like proprotein convertase family protein
VGRFIKLAGFGLGLNLIFAPIQAKALTQSFAPTNPGPIPDFPAPRTLFNFSVSGFSGTTTDATLLLNLDHTFDTDLQIFLIAPTGQILELATNVGGAGDNFTNTLFTDAAITRITSGGAPFTGSYLPEGSLATSSGGVTGTITSFAGFQGLDPNGTWSLSVYDAFSVDTGTLLSSTSLTITDNGGSSAEVPGPLPILGVAAAFGASRRLRRRLHRSISTAP